MFKYLKKQLGIIEIQERIERIPVLNERYLKLLTPLECLLSRLNEPEGDDTLVMHHLRCMGYFGGWKVRNAYLEGQKYAKAAEELRFPKCTLASDSNDDLQPII